jgi:hypothetical protein
MAVTETTLSGSIIVTCTEFWWGTTFNFTVMFNSIVICAHLNEIYI